jgi:hypothetical protein
MFDRSQAWRSTFLKASCASFSVYLLPLYGPHAVWPLGEYLYLWLTPHEADRSISWIVAQWGVAVALQALAGALWYWFFAKPRWVRILLVAACVPGFSLLVNGMYLLALPYALLIERDKAPDFGSWKMVCALPDMELIPVRSPPDMPLERTGQAWLRVARTGGFAILTMPGCGTRAVEMPDAIKGITVRFASSADAYLISSWDKANQTYWWAGEGSLHPLERVSANLATGMPVLSADGAWAAWVEAVPRVDAKPRHQVVIRSLKDDRERLVNLPMLAGSNWVLLDADMEREELTFFEHNYDSGRGALMALGLDGEQRSQTLLPEGVDPQFSTVLRAGRGWVAWDAAREGEPYRVAWSLAGGHGAHRVLKGRSITAVAVDPNGAYLAISTTTTLSIGQIKDTVSVLRASDGMEVWHRSLPTWSRTSLAFLGNQLFAYTDSDGGHPTVRVLQMTD